MKFKSIMLVDDNDIDNMITKRVLELSNFAETIIIKNSGKKGLEYLRENENDIDKIPELIFLDINKPLVDGFVFLKEFERFPNSLKDKCKIIILTTTKNLIEIDRIKKNKHITHYITKPITRFELEHIIRFISNQKIK